MFISYIYIYYVITIYIYIFIRTVDTGICWFLTTSLIAFVDPPFNDIQRMRSWDLLEVASAHWHVSEADPEQLQLPRARVKLPGLLFRRAWKISILICIHLWCIYNYFYMDINNTYFLPLMYLCIYLIFIYTYIIYTPEGCIVLKASNATHTSMFSWHTPEPRFWVS